MKYVHIYSIFRGISKAVGMQLDKLHLMNKTFVREMFIRFKERVNVCKEKTVQEMDLTI